MSDTSRSAPWFPLLQGDMLCAEILWSSMRQNLPAGGRSRLLCCLMHKVVPTGGGVAGVPNPQWHTNTSQALWPGML